MKKNMLNFMAVLFITAVFILPKEIPAMAQESDNAPEMDVSQQYLVPLLEALQNRDKTKMYELYVEEMRLNGEAGNETLELLFDAWSGLSWSGFRQLSQTKRPEAGEAPAGTTYLYEVTTERGDTEIEFSVVDSLKRLDHIWIGIEHLATGTIGTWRYFSMVQWIFAGLALLEIVFTIYTAVVCIREKPRLWGLWVILIISVYGGVAFLTSGSIEITFFVYTFRFPQVLSYGSMVSKVSLSLPICAVIFFIKHKVKRNGRKNISEEVNVINQPFAIDGEGEKSDN